ncbi:MAG: hypothetical protein II771_07605, partial [Clostridia bacterium]|nr:hypothetical protein [Clostridia bacterium]
FAFFSSEKKVFFRKGRSVIPSFLLSFSLSPPVFDAEHSFQEGREGFRGFDEDDFHRARPLLSD